LPLLISGNLGWRYSPGGSDETIAALGQSNRECQVDLHGIDPVEFNKVLAAMQLPFPDLTHLSLFANGKTPPVVPDSFLGGSAPNLRMIHLDRVPFPGLPKLLLSATHLVRLELEGIPHSGYFSPEAMSALLSVLSSLKELSLLFQSPRSRPDSESRRPPPSTRSVIPALKRFSFKGVIEYLEDLVTDIDAPQLNGLYITFFEQINLDRPQLAQFISRSPSLGDRGVHVSIFPVYSWIPQ